VTKTLACYFNGGLITTVQSFIVQAPWLQIFSNSNASQDSFFTLDTAVRIV
jgi:hypothetical protein